jgi:hypothetical protein
MSTKQVDQVLGEKKSRYACSWVRANLTTGDSEGSQMYGPWASSRLGWALGHTVLVLL